MVTAAVLLLTGCSGGKPTADQCQTVSVELADVPTRTDQEPKMRVPLPPGWERTTKMDNESIRFAIRNPALAVDGFTPNAVVTLQKVGSDLGKPSQILDAQNDQLAKKLKATDLTSTPTQVCGAPALSSSYTAPEMKVSRNPKVPPVPSRRATSLGAVYKGPDANYVATLTVQTVKPDDKTFMQDSETILKGFQLLPPR
jgi:hypothetical protein